MTDDEYWTIARAAFDIANAEGTLESTACETRITLRIQRCDGVVFERDVELVGTQWLPVEAESK